MIDKLVVALFWLVVLGVLVVLCWLVIRTSNEDPVKGCQARGGIVWLDPQDRFSSCEIPTHRSGG